jgi:hypothetical protein
LEHDIDIVNMGSSKEKVAEEGISARVISPTGESDEADSRLKQMVSPYRTKISARRTTALHCPRWSFSGLCAGDEAVVGYAFSIRFSVCYHGELSASEGSVRALHQEP